MTANASNAHLIPEKVRWALFTMASARQVMDNTVRILRHKPDDLLSRRTTIEALLVNSARLAKAEATLSAPHAAEGTVVEVPPLKPDQREYLDRVLKADRGYDPNVVIGGPRKPVGDLPTPPAEGEQGARKGWKLVPREPTKEMIGAIRKGELERRVFHQQMGATPSEAFERARPTDHDIWRDMWDASPTPVAEHAELLGALKEPIARLIDPSSWRVMDSYLAETKRKYAGVHGGYDPDAFKHKESLAKAEEILALLPMAGVQLVAAAEALVHALSPIDYDDELLEPDSNAAVSAYYAKPEVKAVLEALAQAQPGAKGEKDLGGRAVLRADGEGD